MDNLIDTIEQTIENIYGDLSQNHRKVLVSKTLSNLASNQLIEENREAREIRVLAAVMDSLMEKDNDNIFVDQIVIDSPSDEISWDDIREAFSDLEFEKFADKEREDPEMDDEILDLILQEDPSAAKYSDYGDYDKARFDEATRAYTDKSLDADVSDDQEFHIGLDKKQELRPGNMADEAVETLRSRSDFSMAR